MNQSFQPTLIFVGEPEKFIAYYVLLDDQKFQVPSPVEAIELTFNLFTALHAEYPADCAIVWQFIQQSIYDIKYPKDKKSITLSNVINKVKRSTKG